MDSLKQKLEKNIQVFKDQTTPFQLRKVETIKFKGIYERLINWVSGEFDLYLQNESDSLKVYFPNGCFIIRTIKENKTTEIIEIKVEGKSKIACQKMMDKLEAIYNHVLRFSEKRIRQYA